MLPLVGALEIVLPCQITTNGVALHDEEIAVLVGWQLAEQEGGLQRQDVAVSSRMRRTISARPRTSK
jgi:hypothetical protein